MKDNDIMIGWTEAPEHASETGHRLLEQLLKQKYGIFLSEEENPVKKGTGGKPFLTYHRDVFFNISHSGNYVICAVGRVPLGIDLQYHKKGDFRRVGKRIMTQEEWKEYEKSDFREEIFFRFWTKKESYLKYTGEGIRRDMRTLVYDHCCFYELNLWEQYSAMLCVSEGWSGKIEICPYSF